MVLKARTLAMAAALAAIAASAMAAEKPDEAKLIAVLQSSAPAKDKAIPCKQLAVYGTKAAVPALAKLLADKELASWARIALEAIPDPAADAALRDAIGSLKGRLLIGTINSIGVRRDPKAVGALVAKLKDADAQVASAAAAALGRIGGAQAVKALEGCLAGAPPAVRSTAAHGCVRCAERLLAGGKAAEAVRLYEAVRKADVPKQRHLEATRGVILARGAAGVPLLVAQLRSADKAFFGIGLRVARELPGPEATEALAAELSRLAPGRRAMLLYALADRGDRKALPAVLAAAGSGPKAVRLVAMGALARLGNASCLPVLLAAAVDADAELASTAKATLARLPGDDVDAAMVARLAKASGKVRQVLIELTARREIEAGLPALARSAEDADAAVRAAAVAAIGAIGGEKQAADLVRILQKTADAKERAAIGKALRAIGARTGAACVQHLTPLARSGEGALRALALPALACAGGPDALAAVGAALDDKDEAVQDAAARALSTWPNNWPDDLAVAKPLLALAKSGKKLPHRVLALRGYLEMVRGARKLKDGERLARVGEVLPLIQRREEKQLAVSVLGTIRAAGALARLAAFAADKSVSEEASAAIVELLRRGGVPGASKDQRRKALQAAVANAKSGRTKKRAGDMLKAIR